MKKIINFFPCDILLKCCIILSCEDMFKESPQNKLHFKNLPKDKNLYIDFKTSIIMIKECF